MNAIILWICAVIALAVFAVMLYSVATFRSAPTLGAASRARSTTTEVLWTLIPIVIVISAAFPVIRALDALGRAAGLP